MCSKGTNGFMASYSSGSIAFEIAQRKDVGTPICSRRRYPMVYRRQAFPHELRIGCGFIPTDSCYWKIVLPVWIVPQFPANMNHARAKKKSQVPLIDFLIWNNMTVGVDRLVEL